jgi:hypothetical protein
MVQDGPPSQSWKTFLRNHAQAIAAIDLCVVPTRGQVNAVRATFKAGITPSRIARQFGIPQSDVRKDRDVKRPVVFILHL